MSLNSRTSPRRLRKCQLRRNRLN
jgi:hypothetical protein